MGQKRRQRFKRLGRFVSLDLISIKINNWEKHNPRKDVKKPSWFALSNRLIEDADFYTFTGNEFKTWIYILSQASQKQKSQVNIFLDHADRACCIPKKDFLSAIKKLQTIHAITVDVTDTSRESDANVTLHNNTLQNITEQNRTLFARSDSGESSIAKVIPEFEKIRNLILERDISLKAQQAIHQAFPEPEWVISEILKMIAWESTNPGKRKKNFARFATNWLSRSWDKRSHLPGQKVTRLEDIELL